MRQYPADRPSPGAAPRPRAAPSEPAPCAAPRPAHPPTRRRAAVAAALLLAVGASLLGPSPARAQATITGELAVFGANALVGGITSGVAAWLRGGSFLEGIGGGAAGGSAQYVGKRMASLSVPGAGLAGGLVGAAGASMVRNGAAGRGLLDRLIMPVGPIVVDWTTVADSQRVSARLHLGRAIFLGRLILDDDLGIDWGETLSAGAPIFQAHGLIIEGEAGRRIGGVEMWGAVALSDAALLPPLDYGQLLAHERVHTVQDDFLNVAWADPAEDWLIELLPYGDVVTRYVDVGGVYMVMAGAMIAALRYEDRPWEDEAAYLEAGW